MYTCGLLLLSSGCKSWASLEQHGKLTCSTRNALAARCSCGSYAHNTTPQCAAPGLTSSHHVDGKCKRLSTDEAAAGLARAGLGYLASRPSPWDWKATWASSCSCVRRHWATSDYCAIDARKSYCACKKHACLAHSPVVPCPEAPEGPCEPVLPATPHISYQRFTWPAKPTSQLALVLAGLTAVRQGSTLSARQPCGTCNAAQWLLV